jgi:alkaline phosphatase D
MRTSCSWFASAALIGAALGMLACGDDTPGPAPQIPYGVQTGDITTTSAVIWAAADREATMIIRWSADTAMADATKVVGPTVTADTGFAGKHELTDLPVGRDIYYKVTFRDPAHSDVESAAVAGSLRLAPAGDRDVHFLFSADTGGQGWGINEEYGGYKMYAEMAKLTPDFFLHLGDIIYSDKPFSPEVAAGSGAIWRNRMIEGITPTKVAETIEEFRNYYRYNLLDEHLQAFNARTANLMEWDDHEFKDNWYPGQILAADDDRYTEKDVDTLVARAKQALLEFTPIKEVNGKMYRTIHYGGLLDVFMLDYRSYRGPASDNLQPVHGPATELLGAQQLEWLKLELKSSTATWKVLAAQSPLGVDIDSADLAIGGGLEGVGNTDQGEPLGREIKFAELLTYIFNEDIKNVVILTGDVHYTAAHYYSPGLAGYSGNFKPFWEFVSGPINAGSYGPNPLDMTFGPTVVFKRDPGGRSNVSPLENLQFFGEVAISQADRSFTVKLRDITGAVLHTQVLMPEAD